MLAEICIPAFPSFLVQDRVDWEWVLQACSKRLKGKVTACIARGQQSNDAINFTTNCEKSDQADR